MNIISGIYWDKGRREKNQDSLMLEQVYTKSGRVVLAAVSDGIGGLLEGETASGLVLEKLLQNFYQEILVLMKKRKGKKALERSFLRCFHELNQLLNQYGKSKEIRLGATLSLLLIWKNHYMAVHLGDSRIYQIRKKSRVLAERKKREGFESGSQKGNGWKLLTAVHADRAGRLLKCVGSFAYQCPDIQKGKIRGKSGFLLCTDGFYHFLTGELLQEILGPEELTGEEQIEKRLRELALLAMKQGETDNISAIYLVCGKKRKREV